MSLVFNIDLHCTSNSKALTERCSLKLASLPSTVNELMCKIEEALEIPESMLRLEIDSDVPLKRGDGLEGLKLRNGDVFVARYYSRADCREINACVEWITQLLDNLRTMTNSMGIIGYFACPIQGFECLEELCTIHFSPWQDPRKYANKIHFISRNGLSLISDLMQLLAVATIDQLDHGMQVVERALLDNLWSITEDDFIRQAVVRSGAVENCIKTLLRVRIEQPTMFQCDYYVEDIILGSLGVLAK